MNLKYCISGVENIDDKITTRLFISASSQSPMDDTGRVSILAYPGPGCTPNEPMALVAMLSSKGSCSPPAEAPAEDAAPAAVAERLPSREGRTPFEIQYSKRYEGPFRIAHCTDKYV
jgi:hypothetical protein